MLEKLLKIYAYKDEKYISNQEIMDFFNDYRDVLEYRDFVEIRDYFLQKLKVWRKVFTIIEHEYFDNANNEVHHIKYGIKPVTITEPGHVCEFEDSLKLKHYSPRTVKLYLSALRSINTWSCMRHNRNVDGLTDRELYEYFKYLTTVKKASLSSIRIQRFTLNYYFTHILRKKIDLSFMQGIRTSKHLPVILTREEIKRLLDAINNLKHRTMIALIYSSGLRLSELLNLRVRDIDLENLTIHVKQGKGRKDRITIFSRRLVVDVKRFMSGREPGDYLFVSAGKDRYGKHHPLSGRTVQKVLEASLKRAGIVKEATPHDLRHSFATHLLENGISLRHIQELLGHKNISTTTIYTRVCNPQLRGIRSPL